MLNGRIAQRGGEPCLIVEVNGQELIFEVEKVREGVYEVVDEKVLLVNDGVEVDMVITDKGVVTHYCEAVTPEEVEDIEID